MSIALAFRPMARSTPGDLHHSRRGRSQLHRPLGPATSSWHPLDSGMKDQVRLSTPWRLGRMARSTPGAASPQPAVSHRRTSPGGPAPSSHNGSGTRRPRTFPARAACSAARTAQALLPVSTSTTPSPGQAVPSLSMSPCPTATTTISGRGPWVWIGTRTRSLSLSTAARRSTTRSASSAASGPGAGSRCTRRDSQSHLSI